MQYELQNKGVLAFDAVQVKGRIFTLWVFIYDLNTEVPRTKL